MQISWIILERFHVPKNKKNSCGVGGSLVSWLHQKVAVLIHRVQSPETVWDLYKIIAR